tara:strand:- start:177 stop:794 length:618 start_codon:yes stop_codon:yes gene_type:complete
MKKISILNYGLGNIRSLYNSINRVSGNVSLYTEKKNDNFDILFIPGVGSFAKAMQLIKENEFYSIIKKAKKDEKIVIGICLGMHLLFQQGTENGLNNGLDFIDGTVNILYDGKNFKLPNIGWKKIQVIENCELNFMKNFNNKKFYFVHSYAASPKNIEDICTKTKYKEIEFVSMVRKKNVIGMQFHPEKSGDIGLDLIKNIINYF